LSLRDVASNFFAFSLFAKFLLNFCKVVIQSHFLTVGNVWLYYTMCDYIIQCYCNLSLIFIYAKDFQWRKEHFLPCTCNYCKEKYKKRTFLFCNHIRDLHIEWRGFSLHPYIIDVVKSSQLIFLLYWYFYFALKVTFLRS